MVRAKKRAETNISELATAIRQLAQAQTRTEKQLERFERATEKRFAGVEERLSRLETALETLTLRVDKLTRRVDKLAQIQSGMITDLAWLKGDNLARHYRELAPAYFGQLVRRAHVLSMDELVALLEEAFEQGRISEREKRELLLADAIVRGRRRDEEMVYLVVEVSWVIDAEDVKRAYERAEALSKLDLEAVSVVAGKQVARDARQMARSLKVWQVIDGRTISPS